MINIKSLPNFLTISRIILILPIIFLMWIDSSVTRILSTIIVLIACITDFVDGWIARKYNAYSTFGKCFDPIADKVLVISIIVMLVNLEKADVIACIIILFREFAVSGIREFVAQKKVIIHVSRLAKYKTASQMIAILVLMIAGINPIVFIIGNLMLYIAVILSVITGLEYAKNVKHILFEKFPI
jgi:CDP-diacylglycerol--glycerol-3-phosphate 3-phosphatidyltransferase